MPVTDLARLTDTDAQLVGLWRHGRSPHTQADRADVGCFLEFVAKPLPIVTLGDVQAFADELEHQELAASSRVRTLAAVKSLLSFGQRIGYLPLNVGASLKLPPRTDTLAERILSETDVLGYCSSRRHLTAPSCGCCTSAARRSRSCARSSGRTCSRGKTPAR